LIQWLIKDEKESKVDLLDYEPIVEHHPEPKIQSD